MHNNGIDVINGNNGTVYNLLPTTNRLGEANSAYIFSSVTTYFKPPTGLLSG